MGLNVGRALRIAGQGLGEYAELMFRQKAYEQERKDKQEERDWERTFRMAEADAERESERQGRIRSDRDFYGRGEEQQLDRLARMGVVPGPGFGDQAKAAMLPDVTPGISDTGGMVLQGLKQQGQAGVDDLYGAIPETMNKLVASKGVSEPLPGGGMAMLEPSVRASLMNAELDHSLGLARLANERAGTANQERDAQDEEAQGLALLNSQGTTETGQAFGRAYQGARAQNPSMSPGRLAMQVWRGLTAARPDLAPARQSAGGKSQGEQALDLLLGDEGFQPRPSAAVPLGGGNQPGQSPIQPAPLGGSPRPAVAAPAAPEMPQNEAMAQRWDELTSGGMSPQEATQRVLQEFGGQ